MVQVASVIFFVAEGDGFLDSLDEYAYSIFCRQRVESDLDGNLERIVLQRFNNFGAEIDELALCLLLTFLIVDLALILNGTDTSLNLELPLLEATRTTSVNRDACAGLLRVVCPWGLEQQPIEHVGTTASVFGYKTTSVGTTLTNRYQCWYSTRWSAAAENNGGEQRSLPEQSCGELSGWNKGRGNAPIAPRYQCRGTLCGFSSTDSSAATQITFIHADS